MSAVEPGQIRRKRLLESEARYRVVAVAADLVEVEVVEAPGLKPGQRFSFTHDAVAEMDLDGAPSLVLHLPPSSNDPDDVRRGEGGHDPVGEQPGEADSG
jgi:hypothetical protein